jgi:hypothetical protein
MMAHDNLCILDSRLQITHIIYLVTTFLYLGIVLSRQKNKNDIYEVDTNSKLEKKITLTIER